MGLNSHGLFVGLTNRPTDERRPGRRSRGLLVIDALRCRGAPEVAADLRRESQQAYNPFNLLYADGEVTYVTCQREEGLETLSLGPGCHVLCNHDINDETVPKVAQIKQELDRLDLGAPFGAIFESLADLLRSHADRGRPLDNVCVHARDMGYGTRSSSIWAIGERQRRFWYADGPPCETKYRNFTALLDELQQPRRGAEPD
jgi:uncharacterized protein with NRDE domain